MQKTCFLPFFLAWNFQHALGDFLGLSYPAPTDFSSDSSLIRAAWENASSILDDYLQHAQRDSTTSSYLNGTEDVTFSAGVFSLHDAAALRLQYHYTSPQVAKNTNGANQVNGDSIYSIASISKAITVLVALQTLKTEDWARPVSDILPELKSRTNSSSTGPQWHKITPWMLASQLSGVSNEPPADGVDVLFQMQKAASKHEKGLAAVEKENGFPVYTDFKPFKCALANCTQDDFLSSLAAQPPSFEPGLTAAYSDTGFMVLGSILAKLTGKTYGDLYNEVIFKPLGMASSNVNVRKEAEYIRRTVLPDNNLTETLSIPENVVTKPSGGLSSTINDLNKLGVGILNSTLISEAMTRAWLKPHAHTASLTISVGGPWEIFRFVHSHTQKVTDIYAKAGDYGFGGGFLALLPEYNAGFTFLNSATTSNRSKIALRLVDFIGTSLIPAFEAQAAAETCQNFAGSYTATGATANSTLVLECDKGTTGLILTRYISAGVNVREKYFDGRPHTKLFASTPHHSARRMGSMSFQASLDPQRSSYMAAGVGPFSHMYLYNGDFVDWDGPLGHARYGGRSLSTFAFDVDEKGKATQVTNSAFAVTMKRSVV